MVDLPAANQTGDEVEARKKWSLGTIVLRLPRRMITALLRGYKLVLSPLLPPACRYHPSCSEYCATAVRRFGVIRGSWMGLRRILRCHPLSRGGYDPVEPGVPSDSRQVSDT